MSLYPLRIGQGNLKMRPKSLYLVLLKSAFIYISTNTCWSNIWQKAQSGKLKIYFMQKIKQHIQSGCWDLLCHFQHVQVLSMQVVQFRFDGQAINKNDTRIPLEMKAGKTIEVCQQENGGNLILWMGWYLSDKRRNKCTWKWLVLISNWGVKVEIGWGTVCVWPTIK